MRRSVEDLQAFYRQPAGVLAQRLVARRLNDAWGVADGCDVLGLGYCTPWLDGFSSARRVIAAMPGGQGAEVWPQTGRGRALLADEARLPFPAGLFDRVVLIHALEEADNAAAVLAEAVRVMAPAGRIIVATAARGGLWARTESTPFGHGRPFTRGQLENLARLAELEPLAWSQTLYAPPWRPLLKLADGFEQIGGAVFPGAAGLILMEAVRRTYAPNRARGAAAPVRRALAKGVLAPQSNSRGASRFPRSGSPSIQAR